MQATGSVVRIPGADLSAKGRGSGEARPKGRYRLSCHDTVHRFKRIFPVCQPANSRYPAVDPNGKIHVPWPPTAMFYFDDITLNAVTIELVPSGSTVTITDFH